MKNTVHVLDCTLRDGGYVNNWQFGDEPARQIVELNAASGVDYVELAFIRSGIYEPGRLEYSTMDQIARIFRPSRHKLAAMVEIGYGYPVDAFPERSEQTVDLVRLVVWKRMIPESVAYAKALLAKGYEVSIQATRIEQYSLEEFADFVARFSQLSPRSIYIVDTFGLLTKQRLLAYAEVADAHLGPGIYLGYHAHNNMQQAVSNMVAICEHPWRHELMLDASVMGIGRGAGNLCLELLETYLNENFGGAYRVDNIFACAEKYIQPIFQTSPWGYSIPYLLSALNGRNPTYVGVFTAAGLSTPEMAAAFSRLRACSEGIRFDPAVAERIVHEIRAERGHA